MGNHVLFKTGIRRIGSKESGFFYRYPGTNETVREERVLRRIENLKVPPDAARIGYTYRSASVVCFPVRPRQRDARHYRPEKTGFLTPSRRLQAWSARS